MCPGSDLITHFHAIKSWLKEKPGYAGGLYLRKNAKDKRTQQLIQLARHHDVPIHWVPPAFFHQKGLEGKRWALFVQGVEIQEEQAFLTSLGNHNLLVLENIEDPQNLGALFRASLAFDVRYVALTRYQTASIGKGTLEASAGALSSLTLGRIHRMQSFLAQLKSLGYWIYGTSHKGKRIEKEEKILSPWALVVGNEARGLRPSTLKACDEVLALPTHPAMPSLNVAQAASIFLYVFTVIKESSEG